MARIKKYQLDEQVNDKDLLVGTDRFDFNKTKNYKLETLKEYFQQGSGGNQDLGYVASPTQGEVTITNGNDAIIPLADNTNAGLLSPTEKQQIANAVQPNDLADVATSGDYNDLINTPTPVDISGLVPYNGATQNVDLGEYQIKAGQVEFDTTPTGTSGVGVMRWNDSDGTLDLGLKGGNVTLQIGQEQLVRAVNKTATNITLLESNYQAVRVTGAQGQRLKVDLALATNDLLSAETIGLVTETIANNQEGFITVSGLVRNINTTGSLQGETWEDGDVLYLSPSIAGRITNIKPTAPNHLVVIGYVVYAHANNGKIFVKVNNGYELEELHNVTSTNYTTPIDTDSVLTFDVNNSLWKRLSWANIKSNLKTYFDTIYQTALGFIPENVANKVTNLNTPNNTTYPTTQAVSDGLATKQNTLINPITGTGTTNYVSKFTGSISLGDSQIFDNGTNIGIGTTSPSYKLDLGVSNGMRLGSLNIVDGGSQIAINSSLLRIYSGAGVKLSYFNGTSIVDGVLMNSSGSVGIGTTTPNSRLDVNGDGRFQTNLTIGLTTNNNGARTIFNGSAGRSFQIANNWNTGGSFEITPSTTTAGSTFTTPALVVNGTTSNVGIGTTTPTRTLTVKSINASSAVRVEPSAGTNGATQEFTNDGGTWLIGSENVGGTSIGSGLAYSFSIGTTSNRPFSVITNNVNRLSVLGDGNVGIGTTSTTSRLELVPTANQTSLTLSGYSLTGANAQPALDISGTWNTTGTPTLIRANVTNTASNAASLLMDLQVGGVSQFNVTRSGTVSSTRSFDAPAINVSTINGYTNTSGTLNFLRIAGNIIPSSGNASFNTQIINPTINQTGGANGITRGLYVNPTLTSAASWRSIEWSNNTGFGLYGTGTANNYLNGNLGIGTTSPSSKLDVNGDAYVSGLGIIVGGTITSSLTVQNPVGGASIVCTDSVGEVFRVEQNGTVGIGTSSPNASSIIDATSTTKGFLPPRMTTTQRNAIVSPAAGLIIYNTTDNKHQGYNGTSWNNFY